MPNDLLKIAIKGTTQDHLPIEDIVDNMVLLKDGSCAEVIQVSSVNFDLLADVEREALVYAYSGVLNSLNFSIQILIRSTTKDVSSYLKNLKEAELKQNNEKLKERIKSYAKFIEEIVKKNDVLSKSFYVVLPFSALELGLGAARNQIVGKKEMPYSKEYILEKAKASLAPKLDHIIRLLARLGLETKVLETKELINLFYQIYNESTGSQKVQTLGFSEPLVRSKIE